MQAVMQQNNVYTTQYRTTLQGQKTFSLDLHNIAIHNNAFEVAQHTPYVVFLDLA